MRPENWPHWWVGVVLGLGAVFLAMALFGPDLGTLGMIPFFFAIAILAARKRARDDARKPRRED